MLGNQFVAFEDGADYLELTEASIIIDKDEFPGVRIAAEFLADDFHKVIERKPRLLSYDSSSGIPDAANRAIIVGTLQSSLVQIILRNSSLSAKDIQGQWESFFSVVVNHPLEKCDRALLIVGSDRRGAIYGIYTLSEQIGVSPWYWWADVKPLRRSQLFAKPDRIKQGSPSVKYRGIFINDEAPSLTGWVLEKFGTCYNVEFYKKVFELLLRLKANFLWPAMWPGYPNPGNSFFTDDTLNQKTADEWGIVISTSHHEPMQRAMNEWFSENPEGSWSYLKNKEKIQQYFRDGASRAQPYESYITVGMRGDGDREMAVDDPPAVLKDILRYQRKVFKDIYGSEDGSKQLLALYKEVQEYFEGGLEVPHDITLLFADDNFGTIRRLPKGNEINRKGRAGVYYHLEYVGEPRSYKWINSNSCGRMWQQLKLAHERQADQIWVFNVGDIKPIELPLSFALSLAWSIDSVAANDFASFFHTFALTHLPRSKTAEVAQLLFEHDRMLALRRHEHIESVTFSLLNYHEAQQISNAWSSLLDKAQHLYDQCHVDERPAFYELVLHPINASQIYVEVRLWQAKNQLYAIQRRNSANKVAAEVLRLFDDDYDLSEEFHKLLGGKWNHIMQQTHYGYRETWHAPSRDMISGLCYVQTRQDSNPIVGQMGIAVEGSAGIRPGLTNEESDRTHPSRRDLVPGLTLPPLEPFGQQYRTFEVYRRGTPFLKWHSKVPHDWIRLDPSSGELNDGSMDETINIRLDWNRIPANFNDTIHIEIFSDIGDYEHVHLPIISRQLPTDFSGFVESDGCVSIQAPNFQRPEKVGLVAYPYQVLPFLGRSTAGAVSVVNEAGKVGETAKYLEYDFYTFTKTSRPSNLILYFTMTLDTNPTDPLQYVVMVDNYTFGPLRLVPDPDKIGDLPPGWHEAVQDGVWKKNIDLAEMGQLNPGIHTLKFRAWQQNILLEKIVLDLGGLRQSYLGPPESSFVR